MAFLSSMPAAQKRSKNSSSAGSCRSWMLLLLLLSAFPCERPSFGAEPIAKEYQVKAAFLYNFTKFVTWPHRTTSKSNNYLVIGVLGRNPFGAELEAIVRGRSINGRTLQVKTVRSLAEARTVDLLFVPAGEERSITGEIDRLHNESILTVGESNLFSTMAGIITFEVESGKVRFQINREAGARAGMKISPQLLKLGLTERRP